MENEMIQNGLNKLLPEQKTKEEMEQKIKDMLN